MKQSFYLVVGLGKTGLSIARYLHRGNKQFVAYDTRKDAPGYAEFHQEFPNIPCYLQDLPEEVFTQVTDVITSPGVALETPALRRAREAGIPIYGDIECLAREISAPVIAITGTNGKSTVTTLVGEMAKKAGFNVAVAGNIGAPVLDLLADDHQYDLWVLELSSFQLDLTYSLKPVAATVLNVSPDHLDRHHSMEAYVQAKHRIYHQASTVLYNRGDDLTKFVVDRMSTSISFGEDEPLAHNWGLKRENEQIFIAKGNQCLLSVDTMLIKGVHNWLNAMAACALADVAGVPTSAMLDVLQEFKGLAHRSQWVRSLEGVEWINDSKGTNIGATISAINGIGGSMQGRIVLIAGGQGKGADFHELTSAVASYVRSIVLIGEDADKIEAALANVVPIVRATTLDNAVDLAKRQAKPGDVVLLSPACASLDMFRDFNHRGEEFARAVNGL